MFLDTRTEISPREYYSVSDAALLCGYSPEALYVRINRGIIKPSDISHLKPEYRFLIRSNKIKWLDGMTVLMLRIEKEGSPYVQHAITFDADNLVYAKDAHFTRRLIIQAYIDCWEPSNEDPLVRKHTDEANRVHRNIRIPNQVSTWLHGFPNMSAAINDILHEYVPVVCHKT